MARKLPQLQRVLDAPALFSVAYGEIASSIYFALGVVALYALGFTPLVLLVAGAHLRRRLRSRTRRARRCDPRDRRRRDLRPARVQRPRRVHDRLGALPRLPDRDRALGARPCPHYLGAAFGVERPPRRALGLRSSGVAVIVAIAAVRLVRRSRLYRFAIVVALVDLATQLLLVGLGVALLFSPDALTRGHRPRQRAELARDRVRAAARVPRVHGPRDRREPRRGDAQPGPRPSAQPLLGDRGRRRSSTSAIALVALSAFPAEDGTTALGGRVAARRR